jgi:hypothetical protein
MEVVGGQEEVIAVCQGWVYRTSKSHE